MINKAKMYANVIWQLIIADLMAYSSKRYLNELLDSFFWALTTLLVSAKLLTAMGIGLGFGIFIAAGIPISRCLFQIYPRATHLIIDLMSNKAITYDLTLPIPTWLSFSRIIISSFIRNLLLSIPALPFCLLFIPDEFNASTFCLAKFSLILILTALCCGALGLVIASIVQSADELSSVWNRFLSPMWLLGGFQFPYATLSAKIPWLGYLSLANPITYAMEGARVTVLGQNGFLPFWHCVGALALFSIIFSYLGIKKMLHRLDCV